MGIGNENYKPFGYSYTQYAKNIDLKLVFLVYKDNRIFDFILTIKTFYPRSLFPVVFYTF